MTSEAKECYVQLEKLRNRISEYNEELKTCTDSKRKSELKLKINSLRGSINDLKEQIRYFDPESSLNVSRGSNTVTSSDKFGFNFFERTTVTWSDIEGHTWNQLEAGDFVEVSRGEYDDTMTAISDDAKLLQAWMTESAAMLTDKQRVYMDMYYNDGLSLAMIADQFGVDSSTVSRTIRRGLSNMQKWVDSKRLVQSCDERGLKFDWVTFLHEVPMLTDRQREVMLIILSRAPKSQDDLAIKLDIHNTTVTRTVQYAIHKLKKLNVFGREPSRNFNIINWNDSDKYSLCLETGMSISFYYKFCFRDQRFNGITRYMYEIFRRYEAGYTYQEIADELGIKKTSVRNNIRLIKKKINTVSNCVVPNSDTIAAKLDPETYIKLQKLVTSHAGA